MLSPAHVPSSPCPPCADIRDVTLRTRLTLFFAGIVIVPLVGAALVLQVVVGQQVDRRSDTRLEAASATVATLWSDRLRLAERETDRAARELAPRLGDPGLESRTEVLRERAGLDFLVVARPDGSVEAAAVTSSNFEGGRPAPGPERLAADGPLPGVLRSRVHLEGDAPDRSVVGGWFVDRSFLSELAGVAEVDLVLRAGGRTLAATAPVEGDLPTEGSGPRDVPGDGRAMAAPVTGEQGAIVIVTSEPESGLALPVWAVTGLALLVAALLGAILAGLIARPVNELSRAASRVAEGDLSVRVPEEGHGDVGRLARSFNAMADSLEHYVHRVEESRDELRRNLDRMGTTLRSTLDMEGMFEVILDTAVMTLAADSGALFLAGPRRELRMQVWKGYEPPTRVLRGDEGVAGRAGAVDRPVLAAPGTDAPEPHEQVEPPEETAVAVPLARGDRTIGVLALYGRTVPTPFDEADVATLASFAAQASVAIENVLLHREAQRLSITDGLTGLWNRRYLEMELGKEIDRAQRFGRPFSLLVVDIDRFKRVNDDHGHLVGDEVLIEVSRRLVGSLRASVDLVARFGGEEFVAVLPETPTEGARVVAEKIRAVIGDDPIPVEGIPSPLAITVSVGLASFPRDGGTVETLLHAADLAMYRAKEAGRDRVAEAEGEAPEPVPTRRGRERRTG